MRWLLRVAFLACLGSLATKVDAASLPALRIQPLGDSITKGSLSSHSNGYRGYLRRLLEEQSDHSVDMIGTMRNGDMSDNDHEGHSGHFLAEISEFYKLSIRARPNVVLLHAGTNNMDKEIDLKESPDLMESIIDGVNKEAPDAAILVMPVIWANDTRMQNNTDHFNQALDRIIKAKQGDDVHILSVPTNITVADLADFKHPNDQGYKKMADAWLSAILEAMDRGWLQKPVAVDSQKLQNMGLGTRTEESKPKDEEQEGTNEDEHDGATREDGREDSSASRPSWELASSLAYGFMGRMALNALW